jgi:hypothetical protein
LTDALLCVGLRNEHNIYSLTSTQQPFNDYGFNFNHDSIISNFSISLNQLDLNYIKSDIQISLCDSNLYSNYRMLINSINTDNLKSIGASNGFRILPIVYLDNRYRRFAVVGSSGTFTGGHYVKQTVLRLLILIIDGDEIIYLRSAKYFGDEIHTSDPKEKYSAIEQKHWDKLVELVMRDYIKGVNRYKKKNHIFD